MAGRRFKDSRIAVSHAGNKRHHHEIKHPFRISLKSEVRAWRRARTDEQDLAIGKKRQALELRIEKHQDNAEKYFSAAAVDELSHDLSQLPDDDWESESDSDEEDASTPPGFTFSSPLPTIVEHLPEERQVLLPSTLGHLKCAELGYIRLARNELKIREGQANDALHAIRMAIGEKSFRFRKQLRSATSKAQKTRSWDSIHNATKQLSYHRLIYSQARHAMVVLHAPPDTLDKYKVLKREDLRSSTAIQEPNAMGQRNNSLPWIWLIPGGSSRGTTAMLKECESGFSCKTL